MRRVGALGLSVVVRILDLVRSHLPRVFGRRASCTGVVLYYHAVKPEQRPRFAAQMDELMKYARPFPAGSPEAMSRDGRNVAVTFDDGFRSVAENAAPELAKRGIPFTVFVPSGCLGRRPSWVRSSSHPFSQEHVLSPADLAALASDPLVTLGSHSVSHRNLLRLDSASASEELVRSKAELEAAAKVHVDLFSFPHGAHSAAIVEQARRAGYRRVFTIEPTAIRSDAEAFVLGRVAADPDDWKVEFRLKIAGAYRWRAYFHRLRGV